MSLRHAWIRAGIVALLAGMCISPANAQECGSEGWTVLFDGTSLEGWRNARAPRAENKWSIEEGAMTNAEHGNDIGTVQKFKDFDLQLEFKTVAGGNSGVYLRGRIEIQVLDSFGKEKPGKGDNGAIYDQFVPLVNASKPAGEWNLLEASIAGDVITAKLNGQIIHENQKISQVTGGALAGKVTDAGPLLLQGDHGKVWYRNIRIREIACARAKAQGCCPAAQGECPMAKGCAAKACARAKAQGCCPAAQGCCPVTKGGFCPKPKGGKGKP